MNRITPLEPAEAADLAGKLSDAVQAGFGLAPNLVRVLATSPAALAGYLALDRALATGALGVKVREQVALTVAETNLCSYCLSSHSFLGGRAGLSVKDIAKARRAESATARTDAVLKLARNIVVQRGDLSDADLAAARGAGLSDGDIVETVANVALNIFTNYTNHVARTLVDFPEVTPGEA